MDMAERVKNNEERDLQGTQVDYALGDAQHAVWHIEELPLGFLSPAERDAENMRGLLLHIRKDALVGDLPHAKVDVRNLIARGKLLISEVDDQENADRESLKGRVPTDEEAVRLTQYINDRVQTLRQHLIN